MMTSKIQAFVSPDERVAVGRFTYGSPVLKLWTESERIEIGSFCSIADEVTIFGGGEHHGEWITTYPLRIAFGDAEVGSHGNPTTKGPTKIGNDVWIGHGATILSGVTVGDGAIVGAQAVVAKSIPPYHIAVGNPAMVIRARFTEAQIAMLCRIAWWNWPVERIKRFSEVLCSSDVDTFIEQSRYLDRN